MPTNSARKNDGVPSNASRITRKGSKSQAITNTGASSPSSSFTTNFDLLEELRLTSTNLDLLKVTKGEEEWKCKDCNEVFADPDAKMLECERCRSQHCTGCLGKTDSEYNILQTSDYMWFCVSCKEIVQKNIISDLKIEERCKAIMQKHENRILALEEKIENKCDEEGVRKIVKEMTELDQGNKTEWPKLQPAGTNKPQRSENITNIWSELKERKSRERNIVIYGVPELESPNRETRVLHDTRNVKNILGKCDIKQTEKEISKCSRLGKFKNEIAHDQRKDRPILVSLASVDTVKNIFKNIKNLREKEFERVRISRDLTRAEREQEKQLWEQAKQKQEKNSSGEFTYKVRGPPWARKITKVRTVTNPSEVQTE